MTKPIGNLYKQVSGDVNPAQYGATLLRWEGDEIEIVQIQPVRNYLSDSEAVEIGFPFWKREARYSKQDLNGVEALNAVNSACLDLSEIDSMTARYEAVAVACMEHGWKVEEEAGGFARDVFPPKARYWCNKRPLSGAAFADEDSEYRKLVCESNG
jgi:hypothetical protein